MTTFSFRFIPLFFSAFLCVIVAMAINQGTSCFADEGDMSLAVPAETIILKKVDQPASGLAGWLGTYNKTLRMHNASIFTTIFGAAFVAFFIAICWGKLVELYGALGGIIGGGVIVGTFWVMNHKLPGFGIGHDGFPRPVGDPMEGAYQYGLIVQTGPWIDMGLAVCVGLFACSFLEGLRAKKLDPSQPGGSALLGEVLPRAISVILGGMAGGAVVGLIGFTGAELF